MTSRSEENNMDFSLALALLRQGHLIQRKGWNGKGVTLHLQEPDAKSKMTLPYIYLQYPAGSNYPTGARVPWLASQTDLLSNDWAIAAPATAAVDLIRLPVVSAPQTAQEPAKRRGRPKGSTKAKKARVVDPDAPYGRKLDGTPKAAPGRKKAAPPAAQ